MASDQTIVIADTSKKVSELGSFPLPLEVIQYGCEFKIQVLRYLVEIGYKDPRAAFVC